MKPWRRRRRRRHRRRPAARRFGLALACLSRIALLLSLAFLARMQDNLFSLFGQNFSIRDLVLIGGGLFLLVKGTMEIHDSVEGRAEDEDIDTRPSAVFGYVIMQIAVIDILFSGYGLGVPDILSTVGLAAAALLFAALVAFSTVWLRRCRFGPAEWVWRSLTYGTVQPLRIAPPAPVTALQP